MSRRARSFHVKPHLKFGAAPHRCGEDGSIDMMVPQCSRTAGAVRGSPPQGEAQGSTLLRLASKAAFASSYD